MEIRYGDYAYFPPQPPGMLVIWVLNSQTFIRVMQRKYFLWTMASNSLTDIEEHDIASQILKTILDCMPQLSYHGYAMREVSVNFTSLYDTNSFAIKCFSCLFSHRSRIYWILPKERKCVFPTYWSKNKLISEFCRTNPQELKCWSSFFVNYFLRYYLMMQHQPILKRVNGTHGLAHRPYQLLTDPYHCCVYKHRRQDERQPPQSSCPVPICT